MSFAESNTWSYHYQIRKFKSFDDSSKFTFARSISCIIRIKHKHENIKQLSMSRNQKKVDATKKNVSPWCPK